MICSSLNRLFLTTPPLALAGYRKWRSHIFNGLISGGQVTAAPYELGSPGNTAAFTPSLYPIYVRGQAFLASHRGSEAAAEFEKILKWPGVVLNEPIAPLARLGLARSYALQGDTAKARAAYEDFLKLWEDADGGIPVLQQARSEFAKLATT